MNEHTDDPMLTLWLAARDEATRTLDIGWARQQIPEDSPYPPPDDATLLVSLHKNRYLSPSIAPELRHASGAWLRERGYGIRVGIPLLPEGMLPE